MLRAEDPGIGGRKIWLMLGDIFDDDWLPGRDKLYQLLQENHLNLKLPKRRHTTNSNHRYHKYTNLIKGLELTRPNQLWVSDITYIDLEEGCCYLHLVTDAYSRKIVGWMLSDTLGASATIAALKAAIDQTGRDDLSDLIHHSDRGVQYCCNAYVSELNAHNIKISMTEDYKPTDNAIAERVNGIIKQELLYRIRRFSSIREARERIERFIDFYNNRRPHSSIGNKTPSLVHETGKERQQRCWKNYWQVSES